MVILITGASHTGKTALAQKLLEKYKYPYLSIDHLKMGLIRSKNTELTAYSSDESLTHYLWPIVREMIKTAIENKQNLIVEGCYIPFDYKKDFEKFYLDNIKFYCIILSEEYIRKHFDDIQKFSNIIENRISNDEILIDAVIEENVNNLALANKYQVNIILVDKEYDIDVAI